MWSKYTHNPHSLTPHDPDLQLTEQEFYKLLADNNGKAIGFSEGGTSYELSDGRLVWVDTDSTPYTYWLYGGDVWRSPEV